MLPNFDIRAKNYEGINSWGYDIVELAKSLNTYVKKRILNNDNNKGNKGGNKGNKEKVTLLIHDWGSAIGQVAYKLDKNKLYERIISVDIGDRNGIDGITSFLIVTTYQLLNVFFFCYLEILVMF